MKKISEYLPLLSVVEKEVEKAFLASKNIIGSWHKVRVRGERKGVWRVSIELTNPGPINYSSIKNLSEALGTEMIDIGDWRKTEGCDTCDFGSEQFLDVTIMFPAIEDGK